MKGIIIISMVIGSYAGSFIPALWGGTVLSISSLLLGALGGFFGIWAGYKIAAALGLN